MLSNKQHYEKTKNSIILNNPLFYENLSLNKNRKSFRFVKKKSNIYCNSYKNITPDIPSFLFENSIIFIGMPVSLIQIADRNYNRIIILPITMVK
mmetsp:Transcript_10807/g.14952  ORF Transcript_10807/g.14952 Transcript_10807/m.14952 type:complete len:95 (+) Transcript_10807:504-788(+)